MVSCHFQPGEGPSRGLLCSFTTSNFAKVPFQLFSPCMTRKESFHWNIEMVFVIPRFPESSAAVLTVSLHALSPQWGYQDAAPTPWPVSSAPQYPTIATINCSSLSRNLHFYEKNIHEKCPPKVLHYLLKSRKEQNHLDVFHSIRTYILVFEKKLYEQEHRNITSSYLV